VLPFSESYSPSCAYANPVVLVFIVAGEQRQVRSDSAQYDSQIGSTGSINHGLLSETVRKCPFNIKLRNDQAVPRSPTRE
jgi:hypothetical protein